MPKSHPDFARLYAEAEKDDSYWEYILRYQFASGVNRHMRAEGTSRAELARRIGVRPSMVSRALSGSANLSIRTMVKLARAAGLRVSIDACPEHEADLRDSAEWKLFWGVPRGFDLSNGGRLEIPVRGTMTLDLPALKGVAAKVASEEIVCDSVSSAA